MSEVETVGPGTAVRVASRTVRSGSTTRCSVEQLEQNVYALDNLERSDEELAEIDRFTEADAEIDLWDRARLGEW